VIKPNPKQVKRRSPNLHAQKLYFFGLLFFQYEMGNSDNRKNQKHGHSKNKKADVEVGLLNKSFQFLS
jgi:hypothetical protein